MNLGLRGSHSEKFNLDFARTDRVDQHPLTTTAPYRLVAETSNLQTLETTKPTSPNPEDFKPRSPKSPPGQRVKDGSACLPSLSPALAVALHQAGRPRGPWKSERGPGGRGRSEIPWEEKPNVWEQALGRIRSHFVFGQTVAGHRLRRPSPTASPSRPD